jgi:hypothetical protein
MKKRFGKLKNLFIAVKELFNFSDYESVNAGAKTFKLPPSFAKEIRIAEYDPANKLFWLSDARTPVAMLEIKGISTEGATEKDLQDFENRLFETLSLFKKYNKKDHPWTVQMYAKDEDDYTLIYEKMLNAIDKDLHGTQLTETYKKFLHEHLKYVYQEDGIYDDNSSRFKGKARKTRLVFYRTNPKADVRSAVREITKLRRSIESKFKGFDDSLNVKCKRISEKDYFLWMFNKFHRSVKGYNSVSEYLEKHPFCSDKDRPFGYDFISKALAFPIKSNEEDGSWKIGETYHKYISALELNAPPRIGSTTAELIKMGGGRSAWLDGLPSGTEFHMTFNTLSKHDIEKEMENKANSAKRSTSDDADKLLEEIKYYKRQFTEGNFIYPTQVGCFISAKSIEDLQDNEDAVNDSLNLINYEYLDSEYDLERLDKFVRFLPANYEMSYDSEYYTGKFTSVRHIARLAPIGYARQTGSDEPLFYSFNRSGEIVFNNMYHDEAENKHWACFGTTGAGKSVNMGSKIMSLMANKRPYLVLIDAGKSFEFEVDFLASQEVTTRKIEIKMTDSLPDVSLNPYAETKAFIGQYKSLEKISKKVQKTIDNLLDESFDRAENKHQENIALVKEDSKQADKKENEEENRDYIAEWMTSSLLMATNGKSLQEAGFGDKHKRILYETLHKLALEIDASGIDRQLLPTEVSNRLSEIAETHKESTDKFLYLQSEHAYDLAIGFSNFLASPLNRMYFDTPSRPMEDVEITYLELGLFKDDKDSNIAPRALALNSVVSQTMTKCEARQHLNRLTHLIVDECHIPLSSALTAALLTQCSKMARKIGIVIGLATQDPEDFKGTAQKMLNNISTFELLKFKSDTSLSKFCTLLGLDDRTLDLVRSISNKKKCHSESLLVNNKYKLLTRCIPFKEIIFMLMNEPDEKAARKAIAKEYNCSEFEAACIQARKARNQDVTLEDVRAMLRGEAV